MQRADACHCVIPKWCRLHATIALIRSKAPVNAPISLDTGFLALCTVLYPPASRLFKVSFDNLILHYKFPQTILEAKIQKGVPTLTFLSATRGGAQEFPFNRRIFFARSSPFPGGRNIVSLQTPQRKSALQAANFHLAFTKIGRNCMPIRTWRARILFVPEQYRSEANLSAYKEELRGEKLRQLEEYSSTNSSSNHTIPRNSLRSPLP